MSDYQHLEIQHDGGVATIWMNRPDKHNAFDETLIEELTRSALALGADDNVRVVLLAGRGNSFSAGADLDWMRRAADYGYEQNLSDARALAAMLRAIAEMPKPTVARVHGAALGGGMGLVAACDIAIASNNAVFATSEVRFGLIPATIGPYVLRAIGARQAGRYFQTAERIDAATALRIGLVHETVNADQLDAKLGELLTALRSGGPEAQAASKRLIANVSNASLDDALIADTADRIARIRAGDEAKEGIAAFLAKRAPAWQA
ncbi:MAG: enoyl-CoA hydratase/isomerase family protein [Dokdonella sp.]